MLEVGYSLSKEEHGLAVLLGLDQEGFVRLYEQRVPPRVGSLDVKRSA